MSRRTDWRAQGDAHGLDEVVADGWHVEALGPGEWYATFGRGAAGRGQ